MIASAGLTEVSGAVDSQNAAIHDGLPAAAGSVHLQDEPNSPVVRAKIRHESLKTCSIAPHRTQLVVIYQQRNQWRPRRHRHDQLLLIWRMNICLPLAQWRETRLHPLPQTMVRADFMVYTSTHAAQYSFITTIPPLGTHSSLGASQLATAHDRAVSSVRRSASPSPSANAAPQHQRSLASPPHAAPVFNTAPGPTKTRMSQSAISREHSTGDPAVAHAPASVYAQDGLPNRFPAVHQPALNALQHAATQRQSEVGQSAQAALSDVSLGFPQLRAHRAPAANVAPQAPGAHVVANGLQAHTLHPRPPHLAHAAQPQAEQPQAATVTTGASLSEGKTVAMHPAGGTVHAAEAAMSSQAHAPDAPQQVVLAQLQAALHQQLHCQTDGRHSGGGSAMSGQDARYVCTYPYTHTCI